MSVTIIMKLKAQPTLANGLEIIWDHLTKKPLEEVKSLKSEVVLKGWSLLPNALRPFQIYCAPPNLGIRR